MTIYVLQGDKQLGPFTLEAVNDKLARGELVASALARLEGSTRWAPLSEVAGVVLPREPQPVHHLPEASSDMDTQAAASSPAESADPVDLFFDNVRDAFCRAATHLVKPFDGLQAHFDDPLQVDLNAFFNAFLQHGNQFNTECPLAFATVLRHSTLLDSVRGTTTKQLATEIRSEAFDHLDEILNRYGATMSKLNEELLRVNRQLNRLSGPEDALTLIDLQARGNIAISGIRKTSLEHVREFLGALRNLPVPLMDYVAAKCFGGSVDLQKQAVCTEACIQRCEELTSSALLNIETIFQRREEEARKPQPAPQLPRVAFRLGCGGVFWLAVALLGFITLYTTLTSEPKRPSGSADAREIARDAREAQEDRTYGVWWGVGLMVAGVSAPLLMWLEVAHVNRTRGY